jgi:TPR repeat protein
VNKDEKEAIIWLRKAVDNNDRDACWILGKLLFENEYKKELSTRIGGSYHEAVALIKRAASKVYNHGEIIYTQIYIYIYGKKYKKARIPFNFKNNMCSHLVFLLSFFFNFNLSIFNFKQKGSKEGYYHIALMHEYGRGMPLDYPAAVKLYRQSSNLGYTPALYNLGLMYAYGRGVHQVSVQLTPFMCLIHQNISLFCVVYYYYYYYSFLSTLHEIACFTSRYINIHIYFICVELSRGLSPVPGRGF